jgi:lipoyl-dependent peroxiredoxin
MKGLEMTTTRTANAHWEGSLVDGAGSVSLDSSGAGSFDVTWPSRAEEANGKTSPEELIAAAHSTCFSMALSLALAGDGHAPQAIDTRADVTFQPGKGITGITLSVRGKVEGISNEQFVEYAEGAKLDCPVSRALTGTTIELDASLV